MFGILLQDWIVGFSLILARTGMFVTTFPFFGSSNVPLLVRTSLMLSFAMFWFTQYETLPAQELREIGSHWMLYAFTIGKEVMIGAILGYGFGMVLVPFRVAGEFIAQEMGLTIASITDPTRNERGTVVGQAFETMGILLFFLGDLHHVFIGAFHASFAARPVGGSLGDVNTQGYVQAVGWTQEWGMAMAAPVSCWLFLISITLAVMARAAPQLNIMSIGFVLRIVGGFVALLVLLPAMGPSMIQMLQRFTQMLYSF